MGLFDMFKSEPPKLSPRMALAVGLLYMMASDGQIEQEEIGQLQSVVGGDRSLLETAVKYWRAVSFDQFLQAAPGVLMRANAFAYWSMHAIRFLPMVWLHPKSRRCLVSFLAPWQSVRISFALTFRRLP